jgi:hypothetical protein
MGARHGWRLAHVSTLLPAACHQQFKTKTTYWCPTLVARLLLGERSASAESREQSVRAESLATEPLIQGERQGGNYEKSGEAAKQG